MKKREKPIRAKDLRGQKFGRLVVTEYAGLISAQNKWKCICDCGKTHTASTSSLTSGKTKSCGCYRKSFRVTHGLYQVNPGRHKLPEFTCWKAVIGRCLDKNHCAYEMYGGSGITVCARWMDFENFLVDMGPRPSMGHTVDRYPDNTGNYEPGNCRWATTREQTNNRCNTVWVEHEGVRMSLTDAIELVGADAQLISSRIKLGWSFERAISEPLHAIPVYEHNGVSLTMQEWSRKCGVSMGTIHRRLRRGWSFDKAISTPIDTTRRNAKAKAKYN